MTRLRLILGLALLLLGLTACGPDKGQAFVDEYQIASNTPDYDPQKGHYAATLKKAIALPKNKSLTWEIQYSETLKQPQTRKLAFSDPHAGDDETGDFVYYPAYHLVVLSYGCTDAEEDQAQVTKGVATLVYAAIGRHTLLPIYQDVEVKGPALTKKALLARVQPYVQSMRDVFSDVLDFGTANAVTKALKKAAPTPQQVQEASASASARATSRRQAASARASRLNETFWPATFAPTFTDAQWRQAILTRAQTLGIKGATVARHDYASRNHAWANFDRTIAGGFTNTTEYYRWNDEKPPVGYTYNRFTGNPGQESVYLITDQDGVEYLAVLPIRLYTDQYLKAHNNLQTFKDGHNLTHAIPADMLATDFVKATATPTASEIANNIGVAKALSTPKSH